MQIRALHPHEIGLLRKIDRSEIIEEIYYLRNGQLILEQEYYDMKGFPPGELEAIILRQHHLVEAGGEVFAAFDDGALLGVASVENRLRGLNKPLCKMDILYTDAQARKRGVGRALIGHALDLAHRFGACGLYISATPSRNTVDFYIHCGAVPVEEVDSELFTLEPEDIHLQLCVSLVQQ